MTDTKADYKILDESDFDVYGDKVKLDIWLRKGEMDKILENQDKADKWDKHLTLNKDNLIGYSVKQIRELEAQVKSLQKDYDDSIIEIQKWKQRGLKNKEIVQKISERFGEIANDYSPTTQWTKDEILDELNEFLGDEK